MASLASINIKFSADLRQFSSEMQSALRSVKKTGEEFQRIGGALSVGLTLPLLAAGAASVKMASDYEESLNKVNVAFGDSASSIEAFGDTTLETFGIAKGTALDMASLFGDMATSMGLPQAEAADLSKSLVGLAGDLASFKNIGIEQATTALNGVFTGETESLKLLGIVMTEANLAQFALEQGIQKNIKSFTQAEKVQLRYAFVMDKTRNAQGDFARTSGGSANQLRIFQESLKEIGQQFGAIILPAFTKVVQSLNGMVQSFSKLSPAAKENIVIIAGLVAVVGPLLAVFGTVLTIIPSMVAGFAAMKAAVLSFTAVLAANPFTAIAVAIGLIVAALVAWNGAQKKTLTGQQALNKALNEGVKNSATEIAQLDKLYKAATDVNASVKERKAAIDELQKTYPAYFKNIDTENIKNGQAIGVYKELRQAIFDKARASAIDAELQKRAEERIAKEVAIRQKIAKTEAEISRIKAGANEIVLQEASAVDKTNKVTVTKTELLAAQTKLLQLQKTELLNFTNEALKSDEVLLDSKREYDEKSAKLTENEIERQKLLAGQSVAAVDQVIKSREKLTAINAAASSGPSGTISNLQKEIADLQAFQNEVSTTAEMWQAAQKAIEANEIQIKIASEGYAALIDVSEAMEEFKTNYEATKEQVLAANEAIKEQAIMVADAVGGAFSDLSNRYVESLGLAETGLEGFAKVMLQTVTKLLAMALSNAIANAIVGATQSGNATGPGAVFATPAFIATAVGGILAAFASIPKFETGGVVGGSSYYGDKILARVNSGELILNQRQQQRLFGMLESSRGSQNVTVGVQDIVLSGESIRVVLDRTDAKNNRRK